MTDSQTRILKSLLQEMETLSRNVVIAKLALTDETELNKIFADTLKVVDGAKVNLKKNLAQVMESIDSDKLKVADKYFPGMYEKLRAELFDLIIKDSLLTHE